MLGLVFLLAGTPHGLGFSHDAVFYWSGAEGLLEGHGISRPVASGAFLPITHFPPLYPALLALGSALSGAHVEAVARGLAALLIAGNLMLIWWLVRTATDSAALAGLASLAALSAPTLLERHLWAMSEPLYLALVLLTVSWLVTALSDVSSSRWPAVLAGGAAGLALLTRYAGVSLVVTGALVLLLARGGTRQERVRRSAIFAAIGLLPGLAWQIRNAALTGTASNRVLGWHPPTVDQLKAAGATLAAWLPLDGIPTPLRAGAVGLIGVLVLLGAIRVWRSGAVRDRSRALLTVSITHGAIYVGFLLVSLTLFDASTRLDPRILSPVFVVGLLCASVVAWEIYRRTESLPFGIALIAAAAALISVQARDSLRLLEQAADAGLGFSSMAWRNSETVRAAAQLDPELGLYSNEALPLYFLTGRPVSAVPEVTDPVKRTIRQDYMQLLAGMRGRLLAGEAALVLFRPESLAPELADLASLTEGLHSVFAGADGAIYLAGDRVDE